MKHVLFQPDLDGISRDEVSALLQKHAGNEFAATWSHDGNIENVEVWVNPEHELSKRVLDSLPNLKMISLAFTGYDQDDVRYCRSRGLKVYYVPDYSSRSVAELAVGLTLAVLRKVCQGDRNLRKGGWDKGVSPGIELHGKKVAILGVGAIGTRSAELFQAFGCEVVGWVRKGRQRSSDLGFSCEQDLRKIFTESDIIVLHLPVNDGTRRIVGEELLHMMKPSAVLVNAARAELVDTDALVAALSNERILGAGIDVFDEEKRLRDDDLNANPFKDLQNVVTTPHIGFKTAEALYRLADAAIKNIGFFLASSKENLLE